MNADQAARENQVSGVSVFSVIVFVSNLNAVLCKLFPIGNYFTNVWHGTNGKMFQNAI